MAQAFATVDDVLRSGVIGIAEIILRTGLVTVDFADVRAVMKDAGASPIVQAKRVVFIMYEGPDLRLSEINAASEVI
jgi:cell division protein FtsZ